MSKCKESNCEMNGVIDCRCCYYCEHQSKCSGFCVNLEELGNYEDIAKECEKFSEQ